MEKQTNDDYCLKTIGETDECDRPELLLMITMTIVIFA